MIERALPTYFAERCNACGLCVVVCPHSVLSLVHGRAVFSKPEACTYCGECELACPAGAVELYFEIVDGPQATLPPSHELEED